MCIEHHIPYTAEKHLLQLHSVGDSNCSLLRVICVFQFLATLCRSGVLHMLCNQCNEDYADHRPCCSNTAITKTCLAQEAQP